MVQAAVRLRLLGDRPRRAVAGLGCACGVGATHLNRTRSFSAGSGRALWQTVRNSKVSDDARERSRPPKHRRHNLQLRG